MIAVAVVIVLVFVCVVLLFLRLEAPTHTHKKAVKIQNCSNALYTHFLKIYENLKFSVKARTTPKNSKVNATKTRQSQKNLRAAIGSSPILAFGELTSAVQAGFVFFFQLGCRYTSQEEQPQFARL